MRICPSSRTCLKPGKRAPPQLHEHAEGNVLVHYRIRHGNMEAGWRQARGRDRGQNITPATRNTPICKPEAGLDILTTKGRVTVVVAGQWVHEDREQIAHALNLPEEQVRVIYPAIGGAFGGREDMSVQIVLALAALNCSAPVKIIWSREESIIGHHKRHPMNHPREMGRDQRRQARWQRRRRFSRTRCVCVYLNQSSG